AGRLDDVEELLGPVGSFSHEFDGTRFHDVDELAGITLAEQYLAGVERDLLGWPDDRSGAGRQLDNVVGPREQPFVVRGDDHGPPGRRQLAQDVKDTIDLHVVEVRGRLIGKYEWRVEGERPSDRHPLLLSARQVAWSMPGPFG